ncbi:LCP family protein [Bacillus smithii]|uniref:LCP family protein n=1 Tax=Bacillus smithii TaxID=1479 RepID=UPI002E23E5C8|nr:LCP family protein [Bacillus smithii]
MAEQRQQIRERRKRRKRRRRIMFFLLLPFILVASTAAGYGAYLYKKAETVFTDAYDPAVEKSDLRDKAVDPSKDNISILFIGVDDRSPDFKQKTRSDALILATLNRKNHSVKLLSIPRDSYVYIPIIGEKQKITHAHAYGGTQATIDTVEHLLDVPVDFYVKMNFKGFVDVVNALGGVKVKVPYEFTEKNSTDSAPVHLTPGVHNLSGEEALALARTRKHDNDIMRGERQQMILEAIVKKAKSVNAVTKYPDVIEAVGQNMKTNLSFSQMKSLVSFGTSGDLKIDHLTLKGTDGHDPNNGAYIYKLDDVELEVTKRILKRQLGIN